MMKIKDSQSPSLFKKLFKSLLILCTLLIAITFAILGGAATPILNTYIDQINEGISQDLGKEFKVSRVNASVFPWLIFELEEVIVDDLLSIQSIELEINTLQALFSLGEHLSIDRAIIDGIDIKLVRSANGTWNFHKDAPLMKETPETLVAENTSFEQTNTEKNQAKSKPIPISELLSRLKVNNVYLRHLKLRVTDHLSNDHQTLTLADLDLEFPVLQPKKEVIAKLQGQLLGTQENFELAAHLGPYDQWLKQNFESDSSNEGAVDLTAPFPIKLSLKADNMDLSLLHIFMSVHHRILSKAKTGGQITLNLIPGQRASLTGKWEVKQLNIEHNNQTKLINVGLTPQILVDIPEGKTQIDFGQTQLSVNQMKVLISGGLSQSGQSVKFNSFALRTQSLTFDTILQVLPQVKSNLPDGTKLAGPLDLIVTTSGDSDHQQLTAHLDLKSSDLSFGETFNKPRMENFGLKAQLGIGPKLVKVKAVDLQLGQTKVSTQGHIQLDPNGPQVQLKSTLQPTSFKELVRFLPNVRSELNKDQQQVSGKLSFDSSLSMKAHPTRPQIDFEARASVGGANLNTKALRVIGTGGTIIRLKQISAGDFNVLFDSNLSSLDLKLGDVFQKPKAVPFDIELEITQRGKRLDIPQFNFHLANLKLRGHGQKSETGFILKADLPPTKLKNILKMFGAAKDLGPDIHAGQLGFTLELKSGQDPENDLQVELNNLSFKAPKSAFKVNMKLKRPQHPQISFNFNAPKLDLDRLIPTSSSEKSAESSATQSDKADQVTPFNFTGSVKVKKGIIKAASFKNLVIQVHANERELIVNQGELNIFDGSVSFHPIKFNLSENKPPWSAQLDLSKVKIEKAQKVLTSSLSKTSGQISGGFDVKGKGLTWSEISSSLDGEGRFKLEKGMLKGFDLQSQLTTTLMTTLKQKIRSIKIPKTKKRNFKLKNINEMVEIREGKIYFKDGLKLKTAEGPAHLDGYVGLNGQLQLKSELRMTAKRASQLMKTSITKPKKFPISFTLGGSLSNPKLEGLAAAGLLTAATLAYGLSKVAPKEVQDLLKTGGHSVEKTKKAVKAQAKKKLNALKAQGQNLKTEVEEKAKAKANKAKARAEQEAKKAKQKAKKAKRKAKQKAKQKAKDALKGLF